MEISQIVAGIVIAAIAATPGVLALLAQRRALKAKAQLDESSSADQITQAALSLVEPLKRQLNELSVQAKTQAERIEVLEQQVKHLSNFADDLLSGAHRLVMQVRSLGGHPVYIPPERRE